MEAQQTLSQDLEAQFQRMTPIEQLNIFNPVVAHHLAVRGLQHWRQWQPARFQRLLESRQLESEILKAVRQVQRETERLMDAGLPIVEALSQAERTFIILPPEPGVETLEDRDAAEMPAAETYLAHLDSVRMMAALSSPLP